jgi:SAM-dependent methyltransferase
MKSGPSFSRLLEPILEPARLFRAPGAYARHLRHRRLYQQHSAAERLHWRDEYPQLWDRLPSSPYDPHYFFQDTWAAQRIAEARPQRHVDIGSRVDFVGFLTALTEVTFVDIRPLTIELDGLTCVEGDILALPFEDGTIPSASCLHVAEHIGLGRYGDELDPQGTQRAARELARVVAPGGRLLFSLPVGEPRVEFNAHRIHDPKTIVGMFDDLTLNEFAGADDDGRFARHRTIDELSSSRYACGMFDFSKPAGTR